MKHQRPWRVILMIGIALGLTLPITTIAEERAAVFLQATSWPTRERVDIAAVTSLCPVLAPAHRRCARGGLRERRRHLGLSSG
jgi:hypothetical protein